MRALVLVLALLVAGCKPSPLDLENCFLDEIVVPGAEQMTQVEPRARPPEAGRRLRSVRGQEGPE